MYRIDNGTAAQALPDPTPPGERPDGYFTAGDPAGATPATDVDAEWLNMTQEELSNVIEGAGIGLDKSDRAQLLAAINALIAAAAPNLGTAAYKDWGNGIGQLPEVEAATGKLNPAIIPTTAADALYEQILANTALDAEVNGVGLRVLDALADPYVDTSGIDAGLSSGWTHDAANKLVHNPGQTGGYGPDLIDGTQTYTASSYTGAPPPNAADGTTATVWGSNNQTVAWWQVQFQTGKTIGKWRGYLTANVTITQIRTLASLDGANFVVIDTWAGSFTAGNWYEREVVNSTAYLYWRVETTMGTTANHGWGEVEMYESLPPLNPPAMTLVSNPETTFATPSVGAMLAIIQPVDAVTYGTDVTGLMRRAEAEAWEDVPLTKIGTTKEGYDLVFGLVTFAGTSGTALRRRLDVAAGKEIKVHCSLMDGRV
jgi:hypothetical protein